MQKNRFWELEGLRGVAALIVVAYHFLLAFYPLALLGVNSGIPVVQNMRYEDNFYGNPIAVFLSGSFAVAIFFVLCGFVLSIGFFQVGKLDIIKKLASKRYLRLMLPALASVLIAFLLMTLNLEHNRVAAAITHSGWLDDGWNFDPNIFTALKDGIYGIFVQFGTPYNNALWTMMYEFTGSFIIFGFLALFSKSKFKPVLYVFLLFATFNTWFMAFVLGMILADLYAKRIFTQRDRKWYVFLPVLAFGLFLGGYPHFGANSTIYEYIFLPILSIDWPTVTLVIGATIVVGVVLFTAQVAKIFSNKYVSILGKYTFSLYLIHLSILYTYTSGMFLLIHTQIGLGYNVSAMLSIISSIPVLFLCTILFEKYVDGKSIKLSSYVGGVLMGDLKTPKLNKYIKKVSKQFKRIVNKVNNYV